MTAAAEVQLVDEVLDGRAESGSKYSGIDAELLALIKDALKTISIDESGHSALAWRTLNWVCSIDGDACEAAKESVLVDHSLIMAFHRLFGQFKGGPRLLEQMRDAWTSIYTNQKLHLTSQTSDIGAPACVDGGIKGVDENITVFVENIVSYGSR